MTHEERAARLDESCDSTPGGVPPEIIAAEFATVEREAAEKAIAAIEACKEQSPCPSSPYWDGIDAGVIKAENAVYRAFGLEEKQV